MPPFRFAPFVLAAGLAAGLAALPALAQTTPPDTTPPLPSTGSPTPTDAPPAPLAPPAPAVPPQAAPAPPRHHVHAPHIPGRRRGARRPPRHLVAAPPIMAPLKVEQVATFSGAMPTGVTVTPTGAANPRIFVTFPRWGDDAPYTVGEVKRDGSVVPYPSAAYNIPDDKHPAEHLISVQSVVADARNRLWILDTAAPGFAAPLVGGAKLVAVDLATNKVVRTIVIPPPALLPTSYLNDVRFDLRQGKEGVAYITDSSTAGVGGIIVVDLASGQCRRRLSGSPATAPDPDFVPDVDGEPLMRRPAGGEPSPINVASDGIALSADGATLYFSPLSGRHLYSVPTAALRDARMSDAQVAAAVVDEGERPGASDGLEADSQGHVYAGDYEHNAILQRQEDGEWRVIAQGPEISWPDTLSLAGDGYLYFTANQLQRQPIFHEGRDLRQRPYLLLRIKVGAHPVLLVPPSVREKPAHPPATLPGAAKPATPQPTPQTKGKS